MTPAELARLDRIASETWPPLLQHETFRQRLLARQGPFILGLIRDGKLGSAAGAELFRIDRGKFSQIKGDFEVGLFDCWLRPPLFAETRAVEADLVRAELVHRKRGQSLEQFCRATRLRLNLKMNQAEAMEHLRNPAAKPKGVQKPELTAGERERVEAIRAACWPQPWKFEDFRLDLFEKDGEFACALMDCGKLSRAETPKLFKVDSRRLQRLRVALAEGTLRDGAKPIRSQADATRRRDLILEEYDRSPGDMTWGEFCEAFEQAHGIHLSPVSARTKVYAARPDAARGRMRRPASARPTDEERRRLKAVAQTSWEKCSDPDELRRSLIRTDGEFLVRMMDENKIGLGAVASLLRVTKGVASQIRGAFHDGHIDHLIEPPLRPSERAPAVAIVEAAHLARRPQEGDTALLRRLRKRHVVLVPDEFLLKVLRRARRRDAR